jgi:hypothetical protein
MRKYDETEIGLVNVDVCNVFLSNAIASNVPTKEVFRQAPPSPIIQSVFWMSLPKFLIA